MDTRQKLNELKAHFKLKKDGDLADFLAIKHNTMATWIKRNTLDAAAIIAKCHDISANWLLTGKGEMFLNTPQHSDTRAQSDTQKISEPSIQYGKDDITAKYIALLEQQQMKDETLAQMLKAATDAAQAAVKLAESKAEKATVDVVLRNLEDDQLMIESLQEFVTSRFAQLERKPIEEVAQGLSSIVIGKAKARKKDSLVGAGIGDIGS